MADDTIFDETIIYPLENTWVCSCRNANLKNNPKDWIASFYYISTFDSIQSFWEIFNNLPELTTAKIGITYAFFKKINDYTITPSWEDKYNKCGSSFNLYINSIKLSSNIIQYYYITLLLSLIGETLVPQFINGCTFDKKYSNYKISIWFNIDITQTSHSSCESQLILSELSKHSN
jgi:translation initiation factor 4E